MKSINIWFANWTTQEDLGRTTETKSFDTLRDAKEFLNDKYGYITKYEVSNTSIHLFVNGFIPAASEGNKMKRIDSNYDFNTVREFTNFEAII